MWARRLAERMRDETGADFVEWFDHLELGPDQTDALRAAGFVVEETAEASAGTTEGGADGETSGMLLSGPRGVARPRAK